MNAPSAQRSRGAVHLALPLGLVGFAGSWFVSDYFRLGFVGWEESARGMLTFTIPLAGALVGLVLSARSVARRTWATVVAVVGATLLAGGVVGLSVGEAVVDAADPVGSFWTGVATAIVFLPFVGVITWLARAAGRARPGSLVDDADRRAVWAVIASGVVVARLITTVAPRRWFSTSAGSDQLHSVCTALALLGCSALVLLAISDLVGLRRAKEARRAGLEMTPRDPHAGLPCDNVEDMGLGDMEHEELFGGPAYRSVERPIRVVRGSPNEAIRALARSTMATIACSIIAAGLMTVTLVSH